MDQNGQQYIKRIIFRKFEHFCLPTKITKQNKDNWARNYSQNFYRFMEF